MKKRADSQVEGAWPRRTPLRVLALIPIGLAVLTSGGAVAAQPPPFDTASVPGSAVRGSGNVQYYKAFDYVYKAVRFVHGGSKVRVVWTGDGPGACFEGVRKGTGPYRGYERNLAGGSTRRTYTWSEVTSGQRISPPSWLKKTARKVWKQPACNW